MLQLLLALAVSSSPDPRVEAVVGAIGEKDCPRLFKMLTADFQKAAATNTWPSWCAALGALAKLESAGTRDGWLVYRAQSVKGAVRFEVAFDGEGRIAGLRSAPIEAEAAVKKPGESIDEVLTRIRKKYDVPGMAALVARNGGSAVMACSGLRKAGDPAQVSLEDKWHLGSDAKAMTATLAAMLVEQKKLKWTSTVGEVLGWKELRREYANVTLEQLLGHRGGVPNVSNAVWLRVQNPKDPVRERIDALTAMLKTAPVRQGEYAYSNAGYMLAGVMIEKVTGGAFEKELEARLFVPLGMKSCGFGPPSSPGVADQPWAHRTENGKYAPLEGLGADNPAGTAPAGTVHCSLPDWAKFAQLHLRGANGEATLLTPQTMAKLHTPAAGGSYGLGWIVIQRPGGKVLTHDGSNTMAYASAWVAPTKGQVVLVTANAGDDSAKKAVEEVVDALLDGYAR